MSSGADEFILRKTLGLTQLKDLAQELFTHFKSRQILLLKGPLGVGKTELVRALAVSNGGASGGVNEATSPSFAIHNRYDFAEIDANVPSIDHLDLFRIETADELESTGFWDLFSQKRGLIVIEWAERLPDDQLPRTWSQLTLQISFTADPKQRDFILFK